MRCQEIRRRFTRGAKSAVAILAVSTAWVGVGEAWQPAASPERSDASPRAGTGSLRVELLGAKLSADVREQPWAEFLTEVARTTGIRMHLEPRPTGLVSTSFRELPVERALRHVFGTATDFVYRYDSSSRVASSLPLEVWIFRRNSADSAAAQAEARRAAPEPIAAREDGQTRRAEIRAAVEQHLWVAAPGLIDALRDDDPAVRRDAAAGLGSLRDDSVAAALAELLQRESDPEVRGTVAEILATIGSPRALRALRPLLTDPERPVRVRAVEALVNRGGEAGLAFLRDAARGRGEEVQRAITAIRARETKEEEEQ